MSEIVIMVNLLLSWEMCLEVGKSRPSKLSLRAKKTRKDEHDMDHIAHSHNVIEDRAERNVKIGVKIGKHVR
jgi:hypothetical protein